MSQRNWFGYIATAVAAGSSALFLYTAVAGQFIAVVQRALLLMFGLVIVFLEYPLEIGGRLGRAIDALLAVASVFVCSYLIYSWHDIVFRAGEAMPWDWIMGIVLVLLIFEACRRTVGYSMSILSILSLAYAFWGPYMPDSIAHGGFSPEQMLSTIFLTTEGIWGMAMAVGADIIVYFLIFTAFLAVTGASEAFLNVANSLIGRVRGGPAKMAVIGSAVFGTISGSAPANVAAVGSVTIPLMKSAGYRPEFAASVEAVGSCGGQIMPPVMGAAAFIMADILGIPYIDVCIAAAIPAILYYLSIFILVDLEARKRGVFGLPKEMVPKFTTVIKKWWPVLLPLVLLLGLLMAEMTPSRAAFFSLIALLVMSCLRPETRLTAKKFIDGLAQAARDMAPITVVCAVSGIIIGVLGRTGMGNKMSELIVNLSGGNLFIVLLLTMVTSLILGLGLPTVACYILMALTVAPAISKMGVPIMAAHMFVFYFGIISAITPPVAMASFTAAGIARCDIDKVNWLAMWLGLPAYILPFMFVYGPELLLIPGETPIYVVLTSAILGVSALSVALIGYLFATVNSIQRFIFFCSAMFLIFPGLITSASGLVLMAAAAGWNYVQSRKVQAPSAAG